MASVFISYSRKDQDFVRTLYDALHTAGRDAWVDWEGIPPTAEWLSEVYAAIDGADTFVFVLSPDSMASEVCGKEVAHAVVNKKRIIPIVCRPVNAAEVKAIESLAPLVALNWIFMREGDDFAQAFEQLRFALDTDLDYWHLSSDLLVRAKKWAAGGKNDNLTLRGPELVAAERWVTQGADKEPRPTALQLAYITAGRKDSNTRQRRILTGVSTALIVTLILAVVSSVLFGQTRAQNTQLLQANQAILARALAAESSAALNQHHLDVSLLLGAQAYQVDNTFLTRDNLLRESQAEPHLERVLWRQPVAASTSTPTPVMVLGFSADGNQIVSTDGADRVTVTQIQTGAVLNTFTLPAKSGASAVLSSDGRTLALVDQSTDQIEYWDVQSGTQSGQLGPAMQAIALQFSTDGTGLAVLAKGGTISLWTIATRHLLRQWSSYATGLQLWNSQAHRLVATGCGIAGSGHSDICVGQLVVYDSSTGTLLGNSISFGIESGPAVDAVRGAADLAALEGGNGDIQLYDLTKVEDVERPDSSGIVRVLQGNPQVLRSLAFSPSGQLLAAGKVDGSIELWDLSTDQLVDSTMYGHDASVSSLAFSTDGESFASGGSDGALLLWSRMSDAPHSLQTHLATALSEDGKRLVDNSGDYYGDSAVLDASTGALIATVPYGANLLNSDGSVVVVTTFSVATNRDSMTLVNVANRKVVAGPFDGYRALAYSPDGQFIVVIVEGTQSSSGMNDHIGIFDVRRAAITKVLNAQGYAAAMSPDDRHVAVVSTPKHCPGSTSDTASCSDIQLWDIAHDTPFGNAFDATPTGEHTTFVQFSPDGMLLLAQDVVANSTYEFAIKLALWEVSAGVPAAAHAFSLDDPFVRGGLVLLAYVPDGHIVMIGGAEFGSTPPSGGYFMVQRAGSPQQWLDRSCTIAHRNLTQAEWKSLVSSTEPYQKTCPDLPAGT